MARRVAGKAALTVVAASLAVSDSAMAMTVSEPSGYVYEVSEEGEIPAEPDTEALKEDINGEEAKEESSKDTSKETSEEKTDEGETTEEETTEEETTEEETEESLEVSEEKATEEKTEAEGLAKNRVLRKMTMLGSSATDPITRQVSINPGETLDISTIVVTNVNKIEINISKSGSYTLKGSNQYNGAYVDVQIIVADRVTADLNFDGLTIVNNNDYVSTATTTVPAMTSDNVSPLVVNGTANVHVKSNSSMKALGDFFTVNGTLNFVDSVGTSSLAFSLTREPDRYLSEVIADNSTGRVCFKDAYVKFSGNNLEYTICNSKDIYLEGKNVSFEGINFNYVTIRTNLLKLDGMSFPNATISGYDGSELYSVNLNSLPANGKVVQVDTAETSNNMDVTGFKKVSDITVDADGNLNDILVGDYSYIYVESEDTVKGYGFWYNESTHTVECDSYKTRYVDTEGNEVFSLYSLSGKSILVPQEDDDYNYSYKINDETVETESTGYNGVLKIKERTASGNLTVQVIKTEKDKVLLTIDGATSQIEYGKTLSELGYSGYFKDTATGKVVPLNEKITEARTLSKIILETETRDGIEFFKLANADNLKEFATLVNAGVTDINGLLTDDISLGNDFETIGSVIINGGYFGTIESEAGYCGVFDGQGHTVTLNLNKGTAKNVGLFGCITAGASIKNVVTKGTVSGGNNVGALAGTVFCKDGGSVTIENCLNYAEISANSEGGYAGGIVGYRSAISAGNMGMPLEINHCGNDGTVSGAHVYGILGGNEGSVESIAIKNSYNSANVALCPCGNISNCYSVHIEDGRGTKKDASAFASGEVTYLLNRGESTEKWFQTCGSGTPTFSGQRVYAGYADCEAEELSYSNAEFAHVVKGHNDKGEYSYSDGKIVAKCKFCEEEITATVNMDAEELSEDMHGVTIAYSDEWTEAEYPTVTFKYCDEENGTYTEDIPAEAGTWYVKAYVGASEEEVAITDTYTVKLKPVVSQSNDDSQSHSESREINNLVSQIEAINKAVEAAAVNVGTNTVNVNNLTEHVIEYTGGGINKSVIDALKKGNGVALHYKATYEGKEYDFTIKGDDDFFFDDSVQWYGPLYIQHLINLRNLRFANFRGVYRAASNDTIYSISKKFGISLKRLIELNPSIIRNGRIRPGQRIKFQ